MNPKTTYLALALVTPMLHAQSEDLAKKLANPVADLISVSFFPN